MPSKEKLSAFVSWVAAHISGDEKGQAQIFLDRLFQACDQPGCLDVGGVTEFRVRKSSEDGGGRLLRRLCVEARCAHRNEEARGAAPEAPGAS